MSKSPNDRVINIEERHTSVAQFERVKLDLTGIEDWPALIGQLEQSLVATMDTMRAQNLIARIEMTGRSPLSARLRRDRDVLIEEARAAAMRCGSVFIEDVKINVDPPSTSQHRSLMDPVSELRRILHEESIDQSPSILKAKSLLSDLQKDLPLELRSTFGDDEAHISERIEAFLSEGATEVLARLEVAENDT